MIGFSRCCYSPRSAHSTTKSFADLARLRSEILITYFRIAEPVRVFYQDRHWQEQILFDFRYIPMVIGAPRHLSIRSPCTKNTALDFHRPRWNRQYMSGLEVPCHLARARSNIARYSRARDLPRDPRQIFRSMKFR